VKRIKTIAEVDEENDDKSAYGELSSDNNHAIVIGGGFTNEI
jgi:hypothetical protein